MSWFDILALVAIGLVTALAGIKLVWWWMT